MFCRYYPYTNGTRNVCQYFIVLALAASLSACGDDLSDLDALAKQSILNSAETVTATAQLSVEQLVTSDIVTPDIAAEDTQFDVNLATNTISGSVNITPLQISEVLKVQIRRGYGGKKSDLVVLDLDQDNADANQWNVTSNSLLSDEDIDLLLRGGLYVLVTTAKHKNGELRGQLLWGGQELIVIELSGENLIPEVTSSASGKVYLTPINLDGNTQAVVRISGIAEPVVKLFRANNPNSTEKGQHYFDLIETQDYWEFPSGFSFTDNDYNEIAKGNLMFIVTSASYDKGEVGGRITFPD